MTKSLALTVLLLTCTTSYGLDPEGMGKKHQSLQALYLFNETSGDIIDSSGVGSPLNLEVTEPAAVLREGEYLNIKQDTLIRSKGPATKIANACNASNAMSVELWIENNRTALPPDNFGDPIPLTIFGLGTASKNTYRFSQFYDSGDLYRLDTGFGDLMSDAGIVDIGKLQHIYITKSSQGIVKLYVGDSTRVLPRKTINADQKLNIGASDLLTLGNTAGFNPNTPVLERFSWKGRIHLVAVYCDALSDDFILGSLLPKTSYEAFKPNPNKVITENHIKAALIYKRLTGVKTPIDNPIIDQMAQLITSGDVKGAAHLATEEPGFYNITVRDFASRMSTRDETVNAGLNDMVATIIGV
ncbi:MAG: hypothetical protein KDD22_04755, partial [Bdellovibrionales bacterium]|nr:hypothetical protein [Bdellovibrionales bacterium]